jgi:hypothetical protein
MKDREKAKQLEQQFEMEFMRKDAVPTKHARLPPKPEPIQPKLEY